MNVNRSFLIILGALLLAAGPASFAADDGAALFKKKCAGCHGADGAGKPSMKAPAIKGTSMDVDQLVNHLMNGEPTSKSPHKKGIAGLKPDQAKAIAEYVKTLK
jgi:mono/diheme cytochrome c family protein